MTLTITEAEFVLGPTFTAAVAAEADRRHPRNHIVDDPFGATGYAESDPYGYEETANRAFVAGATWAAYRARDTIRAVRQEVDEVLADPLASPTEAALADRLDGLFREAGL